MQRSFTPIVAVPARNEALRLPRIMAALAGQDWLRDDRRLNVVMVLNNCTDDSAAVLDRAAACHPGLALTVLNVRLDAAQAHVGTARRMAMDTALSLCPDPRTGVVLTTDADGVPASTWITANLAAIDEGADLVGGQIVADPEEERLLGPGFLQRAALRATYDSLVDQLAHLIDPLPHDAWPRHSNHIGASLAVRGDVYAAVGGLPALPVREDVAFVSRVRAAGYRIRHALAARVVVSARLQGRAVGGMATCLSAWVRDSARNRPLMVESAEAVCERLHLRRQLRDLGLGGSIDPERLASLPGIQAVGLRDIPQDLPVAALIEHLLPETRDWGVHEPAEQAIARLQAMIAAYGEQVHAA